MSSYIQKLKYISKDDALLIMKEEYGQDFIQELGLIHLSIQSTLI